MREAWTFCGGDMFNNNGMQQQVGVSNDVAPGADSKEPSSRDLGLKVQDTFGRFEPAGQMD